jgi:hypothetical protein
MRRPDHVEVKFNFGFAQVKGSWALTKLERTATRLDEQGDAMGARAAYQRAIDSGHADAAPAAAYNLGNMLAE